MPKVTVVTLPTKMLEVHQQVVEKKKTLRRLTFRTIFNKVYSMLASLGYGKNGLLSILAFLLGRVFVMDEFAPVGLAFFAAVAQVDDKRALTVGLWTIVGVASGGYYWEVGIYAFTICLYFLWADKLTRFNKKILPVPIFIFFAVLCAGLVGSLFKEPTLYNALLLLFEATACMVLSYIFMYGVPLLTEQQSASCRQNLTSERLSCMVMLLATAVAGFGNIMLLEYSMRNIAGSLLVMGVAFAGGAGLGATVGVVVGLIVGLSDGNATLAVSLYALTGVLAGVFRGLGKLAVVVGFILGSAITILYFGQASELTRTLIECIIAGGLFWLVPNRWLTVFQNIICQSEQHILTDSPPINETVAKINNIAEIFNDLAGAFGDITTAAKMKIHDDELARTLSVIGEQICVDCPKRSQCWEVDFYRTYHGILEILGQVEIKPLGMHNMPNLFKENCIRCKELLETIKLVSERNRSLTFWQKKIVDNRQMVTEQMKATNVIISSLAYEIGKVECSDRELSLTFQRKVATLGCQLTAVRVTGVQGQQGMIEAYKMPCNGTRECKNTILPLAAGLLKEKMILHTECGNEMKSKKCKLTMKVAKRFNVDTGMASFAKDGQEVCGDSCAVMELNKGKIALVLSDGMGSGSNAEAQSMMAIKFLQKLMIAGFDTDVAIRTVNSMLLLRSPEESFVTIDMAVIDTYSGNVEFLKIGSAASFIKRVREVKVIKSSCLPIGILQQIEIQPVTSSVVVDDFIVMVSDGVMDVPQINLDKGNWLANFLRQSVNSDPKGLANQILAQARTMSGNRVSDDMTVLVGKIVERPN
ncbi:MAG: stage sporulation protein serine/threonine phosphatase [Firmicutes bacterium]|nr:stage sporulation protein serine/threonine phosphatase [Bacillota bacterium]